MENYTEFKELLSEARRHMEREHNRMIEELKTQEGYLKVLDCCNEYAIRHERLLQQLEEKEAALTSLTEQLQEQRQETDSLRQQLEQQRQETDSLRQQLEQQRQETDSLRQQLQEKEVRLSELGKLSAGVAKKSSQDDVSKALRIYLNNSKRKTLSKREAAKTVFLELIAAAKLEMPEDTMELLSHFDDETPEPPIVIEQAADVIADGGVKNIRNIKNTKV